MTTKSVRNVKIVLGKDGKPKLVRKSTFMAGKKDRDAVRLAKRWEAKGKK